MQGPHHSAQKSTRIGTVASRVISRKLSGSASIGRSTGEIGVLHAPQRPASASRTAGDRFFLPQEGHFRIMLPPLATRLPDGPILLP